MASRSSQLIRRLNHLGHLTILAAGKVGRGVPPSRQLGQRASRPLHGPHMARPWNGRDVRSPSKPAAHEPRPAAHEPRPARPPRLVPSIWSCRSCSCFFRVGRLGGTPRPTETCSLFTVTCSLKSGGPASRRNLSGIAHGPIYTVSTSRPFWSKLFLKNDFGFTSTRARARRKSSFGELG